MSAREFEGKPEKKKRGKKPEAEASKQADVTRRDFLIGLGTMGATAAVGAGGALMHAAQHYERLAKQEEIDRHNTYQGTGLVMKKFKERQRQSANPGEVISQGLLGYVLLKSSGALLLGGSKLHGQEVEKYYLVMRVEGKEPLAIEVNRHEYEKAEENNRMQLEYVLDEKTEQIKEIRLNPR
jgi:hypothetical protein